ncbi:hypothetical protein F8S09_15200 [Deinococcus sp. SDU3-2]|uniref:Lipoprotein n=1 Tax=Deinococcus terrestris TaxID=2651870 RepID=A0A7X1TSN6_9DEIO|nr:hypothetical protein [Deinococcus terrestris]MPY68005.1 hypothetical protein [Deinococcus terrestris]
MKLRPVRLALPLLSCALLITGCRGGPPVINVPSDPAVLHGTWQGELTSASEVSDATFGNGVVYLLQREAAPLAPFPGASSTPPKSSLGLLALDAATGTELRRVTVERAIAVRFRPEEDGAPARLLVLRYVPDSGARMALAELDPITLAEQKQTLLPGTETYHFSADGRWLLPGWGAVTPLDTRTLAPAALPEPLQAELRLPQDPRTRSVGWAYGDRFLRVISRSSGAQPWTFRSLSAESGNAFDAQAQHASVCSQISTSQLTNPADMVSLEGGGAALAYEDGTVELRGEDDRLRQVVNLGGCSPAVLRVDGDVLTFADPQRGELGTVRVSDGEVLARRTTATLGTSRPPFLLAEGTVLVTRSMPGTAPLVALEGVSAQAWTLATRTHALRLETRATWQSKTTYTSVGTAVLDGERLNFVATAYSDRYELKPQSAPPLPVTWRGELRREDGEVVARLGGHHWSGTPAQSVGLEVQELDRDFAFQGTLKR